MRSGQSPDLSVPVRREMEAALAVPSAARAIASGSTLAAEADLPPRDRVSHAELQALAPQTRSTLEAEANLPVLDRVTPEALAALAPR